MGSLIIRKVAYIGDNYYFESPELTKGLNIITGDNGSGKSTFSFFIAYALGCDVPYFKKNNSSGNKAKLNHQEYTQITDDKNNYIKLDIEVDNILYSIKRDIGYNDIFVKDGNEIKKLPLYRGVNSPYIFSDWLLEKLDIETFELSLGSTSWIIGFKDLFRLLYYDQDTEPRKIFKSPDVDNYISDSSIIRKAIFETLIGSSSQEYNQVYNEYQAALRKKDDVKNKLDNFLNYNHITDSDLSHKKETKKEIDDQLEKLITSREEYLHINTKLPDRTDYITSIQTELIETEISISKKSVEKNRLETEINKIDRLYNDLNNEIAQIEKIIFTHDKLNLFSLELCPFCMSRIEPNPDHCICGSENKNSEYEKFIYTSREYRDILVQKMKSLKTIEIALTEFKVDIKEIERTLDENKRKANELKEKINSYIQKIEYSGNNQIIDDLNNKIFEVRKEQSDIEREINLLEEKALLESDLKTKKSDLQKKEKEFKSISEIFNTNNEQTLQDFNLIFSKLLSESSCKSTSAEINDDYMPYIDKGVYREKSSIVPIRLMYYFTFLCLGLKRDNVKHPHFLLIDTPEEAGIDTPNLKINLKLLDKAIELAQTDHQNKHEDYQIILTTGLEKYPDEFEEHIKIRLNKAEGNFILNER